MNINNFLIKKRVSLDLPKAEETLKSLLKEEGFGVLCEIDVKETLKQKLGIDYTDYKILGVCNPPLAHSALEEEKDLGIFLPCNIVLYKEGGQTVVSAIMPEAMMGILQNEKLNSIAQEAQSKIKRVIDSLE